MAYSTIEQAREAAKDLAADDFGEWYGGVIIARALDGSGFDVFWGAPDMGPVTVFTGAQHKAAEIVEFVPHAAP